MKNSRINIPKMRKTYLLLLFAISSYLVNAQSQIVTGVISDSSEPLIGATIMVKGSTVGTTTDFDGKFSLDANNGDTLEISFIGYLTQTRVVDGPGPYTVVLVSDVQNLSEVVVIGYGSQRKKEVTGAVSNVTADKISRMPTSDLSKSLQGQIAGVSVQASSGRPGDNARISIRGLGSLSKDAISPLYIVDGIPFGSDPNIAPEQIESIDFLKDGASAAIYGVRASNGVIIITTKKGKEGAMKVDFSAYTGIQNITSGTPLMNSDQQFYFEELRAQALGQSPTFVDVNPNALQNNTDYIGYMENNNAPIQNYNLNLSGGQKNLTFNGNINYFNQEGVLINSGYDRLTTRVTGQYTKGKFKATAIVGHTGTRQEREPWALYEQSIRQSPFNTSIDEIAPYLDGVIMPDQNEITYSYLTRILNNEDNSKRNVTNFSFEGGYEFFEGFNYKQRFGRSINNLKRVRWEPRYVVYNSLGQYSASASRPNAELRENYAWRTSDTWENILSYNKKLGNHDFTLLGVYSFERYNSETYDITGIMPENHSNEIQTMGNAESVSIPATFNDESNITGKLFRLQYNYKSKYLFSASIRRDGSSKFNENNRYENFPSASVGWNVSEEDFFKEKFAIINNFKLRASVAQVGNNRIDSYSYIPIIEGGVNYPFGDSETLYQGLIQRRVVDPDIKWETTNSANIGLDMHLWDSRIQLTADIYSISKTDMLLEQRLPASSGTHAPGADRVYGVKVINGGDMENKGIELGLTYKNDTKWDLKYEISGTFTMNRNEVTSLNGTEIGYWGGEPIESLSSVQPTTCLAVGYEAGAFFLVQTDGIIQTQEQLDEYRNIDANAQMGDMMFIDQNEDNTIDDNDRVYSGSGQPDFEAGLNISLTYKNWDFFTRGYLSYGGEIYNGSKAFAYQTGRHADQYYSWAPQNPTTEIPTYRGQSHVNFSTFSDYFLEDGTYFRINTITIGYTFNQLDNSKISKCRLYASANNPITITNYEGYDPEVGGDGVFTRGVDKGNYPITRQFLIGVQLSF